jgi:hypothetical protein
MCVCYAGRWELLEVVFQVSAVPYQDVVLFHPEHYQGQTALGKLASGSTRFPETSEESSAPSVQQEVQKYEVM